MFLVPCYKRVKQVDNHHESQEKVIEDAEGDEGWVDTHHYTDGMSTVRGTINY